MHRAPATSAFTAGACTSPRRCSLLTFRWRAETSKQLGTKWDRASLASVTLSGPGRHRTVVRSAAGGFSTDSLMDDASGNCPKRAGGLPPASTDGGGSVAPGTYSTVKVFTISVR